MTYETTNFPFHNSQEYGDVRTIAHMAGIELNGE